MANLRLAFRYAKALLDLAIETGKVEEIKKDIDLFMKDCDAHKDLVQMLKSPIIHSDKKISILEAIYTGKVNTVTIEFFKIVIRKRREFYLPVIAQQFVDAYNKHKGIYSAKLVTASEIDQKLKDIIAEKVRKDLNKDVELRSEVDRSLIGGFVLKYENYLYDASIASQLKELKQEFTSKEYIKKI